MKNRVVAGLATTGIVAGVLGTNLDKGGSYSIETEKNTISIDGQDFEVSKNTIGTINKTKSGFLKTVYDTEKNTVYKASDGKYFCISKPMEIKRNGEAPKNGELSEVLQKILKKHPQIIELYFDSIIGFATPDKDHLDGKLEFVSDEERLYNDNIVLKSGYKRAEYFVNMLEKIGLNPINEILNGEIGELKPDILGALFDSVDFYEKHLGKDEEVDSGIKILQLVKNIIYRGAEIPENLTFGADGKKFVKNIDKLVKYVSENQSVKLGNLGVIEDVENIETLNYKRLNDLGFFLILSALGLGLFRQKKENNNSNNSNFGKNNGGETKEEVEKSGEEIEKEGIFKKFGENIKGMLTKVKGIFSKEIQGKPGKEIKEEGGLENLSEEQKKYILDLFERKNFDLEVRKIEVEFEGVRHIIKEFKDGSFAFYTRNGKEIIRIKESDLPENFYKNFVKEKLNKIPKNFIENNENNLQSQIAFIIADMISKNGRLTKRERGILKTELIFIKTELDNNRLNEKGKFYLRKRAYLIEKRLGNNFEELKKGIKKFGDNLNKIIREKSEGFQRKSKEKVEIKKSKNVEDFDGVLEKNMNSVEETKEKKEVKKTKIIDTKDFEIIENNETNSKKQGINLEDFSEEFSEKSKNILVEEENNLLGEKDFAFTINGTPMMYKVKKFKNSFEVYRKNAEGKFTKLEEEDFPSGYMKDIFAERIQNELKNILVEEENNLLGEKDFAFTINGTPMTYKVKKFKNSFEVYRKNAEGKFTKLEEEDFPSGYMKDIFVDRIQNELKNI